MSSSVSPRGLLLGALGGLIGGVAGYFLFGWTWHWGFYGIMIPGVAVGLGVGWCSGDRSNVYGILAAVAGLGLGLFTEWSYRPFKVDESLRFFLTNLHRLTPVTLIMIGLGTVFAYWFGQGRERFVRRHPDSDTTGNSIGPGHSHG